MSPQMEQPRAHSTNDQEVWRRVLRRRRRECERLPLEAIRGILNESEEVQRKQASSLNSISTLVGQVEELLQKQFEIAANPDMDNEKRRQSFQVLQRILAAIDQNSKKASKVGTTLATAQVAASGTSAPTKAFTNQNPPSATQNGHRTIEQSHAAQNPPSNRPAAENGHDIARPAGPTNHAPQPQGPADSAVVPLSRGIPGAPNPSRPRAVSNAQGTNPSPKPPGQTQNQPPPNPTTVPDVPTARANHPMSQRTHANPRTTAQQPVTNAMPTHSPLNKKRPLSDSTGNHVPASPPSKRNSTSVHNARAPTSNATNPNATPSTSSRPPKPTNQASSTTDPPRFEPRISPDVTTLSFDRDPGRDSFSSALRERKGVKVSFRSQVLNRAMSTHLGTRLNLWEPFWAAKTFVAVGVTSPVDYLLWEGRVNKTRSPKRKPDENIPGSAAYISLQFLKNLDPSTTPISWGKKPASHQNTGDLALLLRMLPVNPDKTKRADCHLWPKGTFLVVNGKPVRLTQRKQQSHDATKWEYLCAPLRLESHILNPNGENSVGLCCYDEDQYYFTVAVCEYQGPTALMKTMLSGELPLLQHLTMDESVAMAMQRIKQQMIVVDDDDDDDTTLSSAHDIGKIVFSIVDPVSKVPMTVPVRGKDCKHWQCFDLETFLTVHSPVSGGRWRCPNCESFINYQDLQVCALTKASIAKFAKQASASQDRVAFWADKTMHLCEPQKLRYNNRKQRGSQGGSKPPAVQSSDVALQPNKSTTADPETIEVIDLD